MASSDSTQIKFMVPDNLYESLEQHREELGVKTKAKYFRNIFAEFLEAMEGLGEDELASWKPYSAPREIGTPVRLFVEDTVLDALQEYTRDGTYVDVYWTAVVKYMQRHELFEQKFESTPSVVQLYLDETYLRLIKFWVAVEGKYDSQTDFYLKAIAHWEKKREAFEGGFYIDYISRPVRGVEDRSDLSDTYIPVPMEVNERLALWSKKDGQTLRTIIYNAVKDYLDHLLEDDEDPADRLAAGKKGLLEQADKIK